MLTGMLKLRVLTLLMLLVAVVTVLEACAYAAAIPKPVGEEWTPMMLVDATTKTIAATIRRALVVEREIHVVLLSE